MPAPGHGAGPNIGPGRVFAWPERELLGSCWSPNEQPIAKGMYLPLDLMPSSNMNAGFVAGPVHLGAVAVRCWAGARIKVKFCRL